ncbi:MAG: hypothetical protein NPIRA02_12840 [Nitrospirales bacterium]|nr:MAG: hypothetical protein NPIRA02_12840 [Nitrospirales bacterium]
MQLAVEPNKDPRGKTTGNHKLKGQLIVLGLHNGTVKLVPFHPAWVTAFAEERTRLAAALSAIPCQIKHVGSTAVPGLWAKPILDIAIGVSVDPPIESVVDLMQDIGYQYGGDLGEAGGYFFIARQIHM